MVLVCNHLQMIYEINWESLDAQHEGELCVAPANVLSLRTEVDRRKRELQTTTSRGFDARSTRLGVK
jgi:hypothetical protein